MENSSNMGWISLTLIHAMKNGPKVGQISSKASTKVQGI